MRVEKVFPLEMPRLRLKVKNQSHRFLLTEEDLDKECFHTQYAAVYNARTNALKDRVLLSAKRTIGEEVEVSRLEDVRAEDDTPSLVIGTIEKRLHNRPSVLKEMAEEEHLIPDEEDAENEGTRTLNQKDFLELEDETQIVRLQGAIEMKDVCTGCVVGLYGKQVGENAFEVSEIIWPAPAPQAPIERENVPKATLAFISGIRLTGDDVVEDVKTKAALQLFIRWLGGVGMGERERTSAARVARVVVAGCSIAQTSIMSDIGTMARSITREEEVPDLAALTSFDHVLSTIASMVDVDVLGAGGDPTCAMLPTQPIPKAAFPRALDAVGLRMQTDPFEATMDGIDVTVTTGQNVSDINSQQPLEALALILKAQHLAPTCPDTVDGFPFENRDPLVMSRCTPHILVAGNQSKADSTKVCLDSGEECVVVAVPVFAESHTVVLVDLDTFDVHYKYFSAVE